MQSAEVRTSLEPNCSKVAGSHSVTSAGDRADILCVLQDRFLLSDVTVTHCCADRYVETATATAGSAADMRAAKKVAKYALREPDSYEFTPLVVESDDCQCYVTHALLNLVGRLAADSVRQLSIALCKGNHFLFQVNLHAFCLAVGKHPTRGAAVPHTIEV